MSSNLSGIKLLINSLIVKFIFCGIFKYLICNTYLMSVNNKLIGFENKLIDEMNESYSKLIDQLRTHKFQDNEQFSNFIQKISIISSKINNLNNDINGLYVNLIENNIEINEKESQEIEIEKKHQKIIKKFLPSLLIHSVFDLE